MKRDPSGRKWAQPYHFPIGRQVGSKLGQELRHGDIARVGRLLFRVDDALEHDDPGKRLLLGHWDGSSADDTDSCLVDADVLYEVR